MCEQYRYAIYTIIYFFETCRKKTKIKNTKFPQKTFVLGLDPLTHLRVFLKGFGFFNSLKPLTQPRVVGLSKM